MDRDNSTGRRAERAGRRKLSHPVERDDGHLRTMGVAVGTAGWCGAPAQPECYYSTTTLRTLSLQNESGESPALSVSTSNPSCSRNMRWNQPSASPGVRMP